MRGKKFIGFVTKLLPPRPGRKFMYLVSDKILDWRGFKTYDHITVAVLSMVNRRACLKQKIFEELLVFLQRWWRTLCVLDLCVKQEYQLYFLLLQQSCMSCNFKPILLQGEKVFYFVEPTEENFSQYEKWVSSARQSEVFFGDMVKNCYKCAVKPGQTMFIPTGTNNYLY